MKIQLAPFALAALALTGCVFGGGGTTDSDTGAPPGADAGTIDSGTSNEDTGLASDMSTDVPDVASADVGADADAAIDMGPDIGFDDGFVFVPLPRYKAIVPIRTEFIGQDGAVSGLKNNLVEATRHISTVWSSDVAYQDATADVPNDGDYALLDSDADQDPEETDLVGDLEGTPWVNPAIPVFCLSTGLCDNMELTRGGNFGPYLDITLNVERTFDPLVVGLPQSFQIYDDPDVETRVREEPLFPTNELPLSFESSVGTKLYPFFAVPRDTPLLNDENANERRVVNSLDNVRDFNRFGYMLFDNSVRYLVGESRRNEGTCALLTGVDVQPADLRIMSRMARAGCPATPLTTIPTRAGYDVLVLSPTYSPASQTDGAALQALKMPLLVVFETQTPLTAMGLYPAESPSRNPTQEWDVNLEAPYGLRANNIGSVSIFEGEPQTSVVVEVDAIPEQAVVVATLKDQPAFSPWFYVEKDTSDLNGAMLAGDRVAIGLNRASWDTAAPDGIDLFDASLLWLIWRADNP